MKSDDNVNSVVELLGATVKGMTRHA